MATSSTIRSGSTQRERSARVRSRTGALGGARRPCAKSATDPSIGARSFTTRPGSGTLGDKWRRRRVRRPTTGVAWTRRSESCQTTCGTPCRRGTSRQKAAYLRQTNGRVWGRPAGEDSKYLLPGFATCAECGGLLEVRRRRIGTQKVPVYACATYHRTVTYVSGIDPQAVASPPGFEPGFQP